MLKTAQALYEQGLKAQGRQTGEGARYSIIDGIGKDGKMRSYVRADRQVITGDNPKTWGGQVKRYINEKIRHGQDVYLMADNGDVLAITANTAGKAAFRNKVKNRQRFARPMTDNEYRAKLNAESHIDELAVTSIPDSWNEDVGNKHQNRRMADQGWDYRTAYFEDFDGSFYEIRLSVSRNGDIKEIYNIGQLRNKKNTVSTVGSSVRKDGARASTLPNGRFDNTEDIGVLDSSIAEDAPLSKGLLIYSDGDGGGSGR